MRLISSILLIVVLSACNLASAPEATEEIAIGITVVPTNTAIPTTVAPTEIPISATSAPVVQSPDTGCAIPVNWVTYTVQSGDTLFSIAQRSNSTVDALVNANCLESANILNVGQNLYLPQAISIPETNTSSSENLVYWLAAEVPETGVIVEVGCGSYIRQFYTDIMRGVSPENNIRVALEALFNSPIEGYRNHWQGMTVSNVVIDPGGTTTVVINGDEFLMGGACSDPEIIAQVLMIVFAEPEVTTAWISVNGMNLRQISDMSGRSGANAVFIRDDVPLLE